MRYIEKQWTCDLCPPHEHTAFDGPQPVPSTPFVRKLKDAYLKAIPTQVTLIALMSGVILGQLVSLVLLAVVSASM